MKDYKFELGFACGVVVVPLAVWIASISGVAHIYQWGRLICFW